MGIDSPINPAGLLVIGAALAVVTAVGVAGFKGAVAPRTRAALSGMRVFGAAGLFLLLLRPYVVEREPDPDQFRIVALADVSGSMRAVDTKGGPARGEIIRAALDPADPGSWLNRARSTAPLERYSFAETLAPVTAGTWDLPEKGAKTALGDALLAVAGREGKPLGAAVVFSDGNANAGARVIDAAKVFKQKGIPVNVVGVGEPAPEGDLQVRFPQSEVKTVAKEEVVLRAQLKSTYGRRVNTTATLWEGQRAIDRRLVELPANSTAEVAFRLAPETAGMRSYRVTVDAPEDDPNPATDSDQAVLLVGDPDVLKVLYVAERLLLNYRFIRHALGDNERFALDALIRTGEDRFHTAGEDLPAAYPEDEDFWLAYDAILLSTGALAELPPPAREGLVNFVSRRGGGLLFFGPLGPATTSLPGLLPVKQAAALEPRDNRAIGLEREPVFAPEENLDALRLYLPKNLPGLVAVTTKRAARQAAATSSDGAPVLVVQAYGAGKTAYWGTEHDWVWPLETDRGAADHQRFWYGLAEWLATGGADRLSTEVGSALHPAEAPIDLGVEVVGPDFEPSPDALVEAVLTGPGGEEKTLQLFPSTTQTGRYEGTYTARQTGDFALTYRAVFPGGDLVEQEVLFAVAYSRQENTDTRFRRDLLEDLARITGGVYTHHTELGDEPRINLARTLPVTERKHHPSDHPLFLVLLAGVIGSEWILRRQAGLK